MEADDRVFQKNLGALRAVDAALADRISAAAPAALQWHSTPTGLPVAAVEHGGRWLWLASRYDPRKEAEQILAPVDFAKHACVVILGVGLGYHVAEALARIGKDGLIIAFEPDLAVLRAILHRVDATGWLGKPGVILADRETDRAAILKRVERAAAAITMGTVLVPHGPTRQRYPVEVQSFGQLVAEVAAFCRTQVATALVNSARTVKNFLFNLAQYAAGADTNELHQAAKGYPAACVGAGPSLAKNVDLLRDPSVRRNVVVITAQTTLKPLLDRGIQPDFVTALDYHEISRRFYEGLAPLPAVTLVAQPLAHHSIVDSFPGPVRLTHSDFLDKLLGPVARQRVRVRCGSTVAHLSFYVAQHLGCDPIILIGQDLGFSGGLYYCPGTAIHEVWGPELNAFNTLEMMEWQRIVRHKGNLQRMDDVHGRPIYSDEQMLTYLKQFERDFATAEQTIIDATEGGLPKQHTQRMTLAEALARYATRPLPPLPLASTQLDAERLAAAQKTLEERMGEVRELRAVSQETIRLLRQMIEHQKDRPRFRKLLERVDANRKRVHGELAVGFSLINDLNTIGAFRRARADRAIEAANNVDQLASEVRQLERDIENVRWLIEACDEALATFSAARQRLVAFTGRKNREVVTTVA